MITAEILKKIAPDADNAHLEVIADSINKNASKYGIDKDIKILQVFIAQIAHESGAFTIKSENMNYSISRIRQVWPSRFPTVGAAESYAHDPKALANKVYNGRMGNKQGTDDGYNFRGAGYLQTTGRESIELYKEFVKSTLKPEELANKMRTEECWAMDVAMWEFSINKRLNDLCIKGSFTTITKIINGGLIGLNEREKYYKRAQLYLN